MLDSIKAAGANSDPPDFDKFRLELLDKFQASFFDFNSEEYKFTLNQATEMLKYIGIVVINPIRLIFRTLNREPFWHRKLELRKCYQPVTPIPLGDMVEEFPLPPPEAEFLPIELPRPPVTLADVREAVQKYTDGIIQTIDVRYDRMDDLAQKLAVLP
jgi:hypothetical protein